MTSMASSQARTAASTTNGKQATTQAVKIGEFYDAVVSRAGEPSDFHVEITYLSALWSSHLRTVLTQLM